MNAFVESGMTFGPFDDESIFRIEKSKMLSHCNNIKPVEFVHLKKKNRLVFVEAKKSSPINRENNEDNYEKFIREITQKFVDSFQLYMAGLLKRKSGYEEISEKMMQADYQKMNFVFLLIIKGHEATWLPPLQKDLENRMRGFRSVWNSQLIVMNDEIAREENVIS